MSVFFNLKIFSLFQLKVLLRSQAHRSTPKHTTQDSTSQTETLNVKGKVHPRTGHESPEGELSYSSTLSLTSALDGSSWSTPRPRRFTPEKGSVPIVQKTGWAPGSVWTVAENLAPPGLDIRTIEPVASRYTN